jgi:hypothetical protein
MWVMWMSKNDSTTLPTPWHINSIGFPEEWYQGSEIDYFDPSQSAQVDAAIFGNWFYFVNNGKSQALQVLGSTQVGKIHERVLKMLLSVQWKRWVRKEREERAREERMWRFKIEIFLYTYLISI